jgi:hypothetical protein
MTKYKRLELDGVKTYSLKDRESKVSSAEFADVLDANPTVKQLFDSLPEILVARDFKKFVQAYLNAILRSGEIVLMMGAHVIKVGLTPLIIDAMKRGWITHLAINGACVIHDVEIAIWGFTSEDVAAGLTDGTFGMARESTHFINNSVSQARGKMGYGEAVAEALYKQGGPNTNLSLLYNAYELGIPLTVHSALGTEIIHQHPNVDGAAIGDTSWTDFKVLLNSLSKLDGNGIVMNIGSAVIMPEVFLKALTVVRNLGHPAHGFSTATFDMIRHYRPTVNVVQRPTQGTGKGYYFVGHHEIMIPLLFSILKSLQE